MNEEQKTDYSQNKRTFLRQTNKYHRKINFLIMIPSLFFCVLITLSTLYFHTALIQIADSGFVPSEDVINRWNLYMIGTLWLYFLIFIIWGDRVVSRVVGAFERVIRELDEIIEGRRSDVIKAREKDELANELLKRINTIVVNLPSPRK